MTFDTPFPEMGGYVRAKLLVEVRRKAMGVQVFVTNPTNAFSDTFAFGNPFNPTQSQADHAAAADDRRRDALRLLLNFFAADLGRLGIRNVIASTCRLSRAAGAGDVAYVPSPNRALGSGRARP